MRGPRIPTGKRVINSVPPLNPADYSEANANNLMFLFDNLSTGDYLEDLAILLRHIAMLRCSEQATPNLTLAVTPGIAWFAQNSYANFAGGNTPTIAAPITNPRRDIVTIRNDGTLHVLNGAEGVSPVAPTIPSTDIPLAQVFSRVGQTAIYDNDDQVGGQGYVEIDLRPFAQVAIGASAMPKIGVVKVQASVAATVFTDVVNFTGAGRLLGIDFLPDGTFLGQIKIIIDGVTYDAVSFNGGTADSSVILKTGTSLGTALFDKVVSGATFKELEIAFKTSLQIQSKQTTGGSNTVTVVYEHE